MLRLPAIRVIGRVFAKRMDDAPIEEAVGDAIISALNDRETTIQQTAMWALGVMKYSPCRAGPQRAVPLSPARSIGGRGARCARAHRPYVEYCAVRSAADRQERALQADRDRRARAYGGPSRAAAIQTAIEGEKNDAVLLAAHFANVKLADGNIDAVVESLTRSKLHDQAWQYLLELAPGRTAAFARHLQDPDERIRRDVVEILGLSADRGALPLLEPMSNDRVEVVAQAAVRAVARLKATS